MNPCRTLQRVSILCLAAAAGATVRSSDAAPVTASYLRSLDSTSFLQKDGAESAVMSRSLQNNDSDFAYFVNYKAEFQVLRDPVCLSIPPVLFLSCRGSEIRLLNNSSMFSCGDSFLDGFQQTTLRCVPTCLTDDECQAVYLAIGGNTEDGPFGSLEFSCHGNTVDDLTAYFKMEGNDQGLCAASVSSDSRLVHIARLGVSCPSSNNNNNIAGDNTTVDHEGGAGRYYSYDDYYMECFYGTAIRTSSANVTEDASTTSNELASLYTCVEGDNCAGNECAIVVDQVLIKSYPDHFQETCLEPSIVLATLPPASETNATLFVNIVQFVASWSLLFDPVSGSFCSGNTPSIIIQCLDNSDLSFINGTDSVNCTMLSSDTMECIDTDRDVFVDRFTNIFYECSGPLVAETRIEYTGADAYCEGNSLSATVRHALQLGIVCDFAGVETYFSDILSECFNARHEFDLIDEFGADDGDLRFTCLETATFPPGSTANDAQTLPRLEMGTDPLWTIDPYSGCFNLTKVPQPTFPPTQVVTGAPLETFKPTVAPNQPTVAPRVSPSPTVSRVNPMIPISSTINATAPLSVPPGALSSNVLPPQPVPTSDSSRASGSSNNIGLVVGASAGGAVIVILLGGIVAALVLHTRKRDKGTNKTFETQSKGMGGADANGAGAGNDPTESESGHPPPLMTQGERPYRSSLTRAASIQETTLTDSRASVQHSSSASTSSATSAATTRRSFVNPPISEVADNCKRYMMTDDETSVVTAGNVSAVSTGTGTTRLSVEPEEHCRFEL